MAVQNNKHYEKIEAAIAFIHQNFKQQPSLEEVAAHIHLSPFHFQRLFTEWAGVSPKKFLQYVSVNYAKEVLRGRQKTLFDVAHETGLSGTSRLHDLFVNIEGMSPGEYKDGGANLLIHYHFDICPFGDILVASTSKGICSLEFIEDQEIGLNRLRAMFPSAKLIPKNDENQSNVLQVFNSDWNTLKEVKLHLKGTAFQLKVWEALLKIPSGGMQTYGQIAKQIHNPTASRAVGTAIGSNPIAYLIPCHRVIQASGLFGGYMWGSDRKTAILGWEAAQNHLLLNKEV